MDKQSGQKFIRKGFSGDLLKTIALICMFADHFAVVFADVLIQNGPAPYYVLRAMGRISFPIFVFLLAEGFSHTGNVTKYAVRLLVSALVSEVPYDLLTYGRAFATEGQNVMFTLFLGLLAMYCVNRVWMRFFENIVLSTVLECLVCFIFAGTAWLIRSDYGPEGVLAAVAVMLLAGYHSLSPFAACVFTAFSSFLQMFSLLAAVPLMFYSGERGKAGHRYLFYAAYPLSLVIPLAVRFLCSA